MAFAITTTHNEKEITFNVVCANSEDEIPELVAYHLAFLDSPPPIFIPQEQTQNVTTENLIAEQQAIIESLKARLDAAGL